MNLTEFREAVAAALDGLDPDSTVHPMPLDAVDPPAYMLAWSGTPDWLSPGTVCTTIAQLDVIVVAARVDVEGTYLLLEQMIVAAHNALHAARFPIVATAPPGPFEIGQVRYLAARIVVAQPIDLPVEF